MIADLQWGEIVVAEKIGRISRLLLTEAEQMVGLILPPWAFLAPPSWYPVLSTDNLYLSEAIIL